MYARSNVVFTALQNGADILLLLLILSLGIQTHTTRTQTKIPLRLDNWLIHDDPRRDGKICCYGGRKTSGKSPGLWRRSALRRVCCLPPGLRRRRPRKRPRSARRSVNCRRFSNEFQKYISKKMRLLRVFKYQWRPNITLREGSLSKIHVVLFLMRRSSKSCGDEGGIDRKRWLWNKRRKVSERGTVPV